MKQIPGQVSNAKTRTAATRKGAVISSAWIEALWDAQRAVSAASIAAQRAGETAAMYQINKAWWQLEDLRRETHERSASIGADELRGGTHE